ncbi:hypothetical protein ACFU8W_18805 [Streptomyces sp. NPDC057565]|uniref:hypothetical protein n=1 Tax=Streptomyces sp. NPDC057565 TaxID=3346169 RepID=UPI0036927E56
MSKHVEMQSRLKNRHIRILSLGSAIGTGLFLVSGSTIQTAGPIVLLGHALAGVVITLAPMTRTPDVRSGAIALPLWLGALAAALDHTTPHTAGKTR